MTGPGASAGLPAPSFISEDLQQIRRGMDNAAELEGFTHSDVLEAVNAASLVFAPDSAAPDTSAPSVGEPLPGGSERVDNARLWGRGERLQSSLPPGTTKEQLLGYMCEEVDRLKEFGRRGDMAGCARSLYAISEMSLVIQVAERVGVFENRSES